MAKTTAEIQARADTLAKKYRDREPKVNKAVEPLVVQADERAIVEWLLFLFPGATVVEHHTPLRKR